MTAVRHAEDLPSWLRAIERRIAALESAGGFGRSHYDSASNLVVSNVAPLKLAATLPSTGTVNTNFTTAGWYHVAGVDYTPSRNTRVLAFVNMSNSFTTAQANQQATSIWGVTVGAGSYGTLPPATITTTFGGTQNSTSVTMLFNANSAMGASMGYIHLALDGGVTVHLGLYFSGNVPGAGAFFTCVAQADIYALAPGS